MFHLFSSQAERREYGGSGSLEMQFCRIPRGARVAERRSAEYEAVLGWLKEAEKYNGFYILGI